jgi:hypothetical protein
MVLEREVSRLLSCPSYVVQCVCGAKRLCREGPTWRIYPDGLALLDSTMFSHGFKYPISEEQHFWMLHKECPCSPSTPSSP